MFLRLFIRKIIITAGSYKGQVQLINVVVSSVVKDKVCCEHTACLVIKNEKC